MSDTRGYDEKSSLEKRVKEIHREWEEFRSHLSTGQRAWLTQIKNHYAKIVEADPEAAVKLLASHEFSSNEK